MTRAERLEESERLKKLTGREIEFRSVECGCDEWKYCPICGGNGSYFIPVYVFCNHPLLDDDRNEACREADCAERERLREIQNERDEREAA